MGLSRVTQWIRSKVEDLFITHVQVDPSDGFPVTAEHYASPGVDAPPLVGDTAATVPGQGSGRLVVVGYMVTSLEGKAAPGELRLFARNADGDLVGELHLFGDGKINIGLDPDDAPARASVTDARFDALESKLNDFITKDATHTHVAPMGGTSPPSAVETPLEPGEPTGSSTVRMTS